MAQQDPFGFNNLDDMFRAMNEQMAQVQGQQNTQSKKNKNSKHQLLDEYGINLTQQARDGKLDPVIGRGNEVSRTIEILNRRTKNNPVLIG